MHARNSVVVPGNHDGVHLGHQALLARARQLAEARGHHVVALTFDPHPSRFFSPDTASRALTSLSRRHELLLEAGAEEVYVQRFDADFASQSAEDFVRIVLRDQLSAKAVVVGHDFRFGAQRRGDCDLLVALSRTYDFSVSQVDPVMLSGEVISSSRIRTLLAEGNVNRAAQCLTRPYDIDATVIEGQKRGRKIGFPTANLLLIDNVQLPQYGVYAAYFTVLNQGPQNAAWVVRHPAVVNIGLRPTFEAGFSIEAHLLDFNGSLVGASIRLAFIERIRSEQKFSSIDELTAQIRLDIAAAGRFF